MISNLAISQSPFTVTNSISPPTFEENTPITITINGTSFDELTAGIVGNALYLWAWSYDINDANQLDCPTNGSWTNSNIANKLTYNAGPDTYTITFTPNTFYNRPGGGPIGKIGFLVKALDGSGNKQSQDIETEVGLFQSTLVTPAANSATIINSGSNFLITANNSNGTANYNLKANGTIINTVNNVSSYSFNHINITSNQTYELDITQAAVTQTKKFNVIVNPGVISQAIPVGLEDGINYNLSDPTKATLVLDAPGKDFIYVAGTFNNYQPGTSFAMKKDNASGSTKFWLELTGLTNGQIYNYQYWVVDDTPIANSPKLVKTADPYSTLVLSPFDDPWISAISYPSIPTYPSGQEREVTVLQTGQAPYVWSSATTGFVKPKKDDLIIYEVLIRDFDANRNYQSLIDRISYFKNLKINAIQLMPIMEFEGNESWGYNTSFHMALDKYYGTSSKFKEFVDLCHANGIAVILDIALNHAFGRNPMNRMWMNDANNDGWGDPATDNPYFNATARHSYSVGSDFNHQQPRTQNYVKRVIKHWIQEYKIDGFRWDLTKGFTQNCTGGDDACTNAFQLDRVNVLKNYVDYSWALDPTHHAIFEHLGSENEEKEWANYRINENPTKGVMMWSEMVFPYSQLLGGYSTNADISGVGHKSRTSFLGKRIIGYPESHDKDRLMYTAMTFGNSAGTTPLNNLNNALSRMSAIGAISLLVPGPKMIWHFASLGMGDSIYTCTNGSVNTESDPTPGDCKLDTKPQPQWINNWLANANRNKIYNDWAKMIALRISQPVFEGDYAISIDGSNLRQRVYIFDNAIPITQLKNVIVLTNFSVGTAGANVLPGFPYTGNWYNLIDPNAPVLNITASNQNTGILLGPGEFRVYGNQPNAALSAKDFELNNRISLYPNPANNQFVLSTEAKTVAIYNITGQLVKSFEGGFQLNTVYSIDDLKTGIYLVKVTDQNNRQSSTKLIKE